jgi:Rrf2 family protein
MHLSKRGEYGLRAMIILAEAKKQDPPGLVQIKEISLRDQIPSKFLEQILLALKNAGLVHSKMGVGGGYYLARPSDQISLGQIIRILDGPIAPIKCVSHMAYEPCGCPDENSCGLRMVMGDVRNAMTHILDTVTLATVTERVEGAKSPLGAA